MGELQPVAIANILLVDDEENILSSLRRVLRTEPYRVQIANGGDQALLLNAGKPLTRLLIDKLLAFEASEEGHYTLFVRTAEDTALATEKCP